VLLLLLLLLAVLLLLLLLLLLLPLAQRQRGLAAAEEVTAATAAFFLGVARLSLVSVRGFFVFGFLIAVCRIRAWRLLSVADGTRGAGVEASRGRVCQQTAAGTSGRPWQQRRRCRLWAAAAAGIRIDRDHAESEATQTTAATGAQGDEASGLGVETEEGGDQGRRAGGGGRNGRYNAQQAVPARRQASGRAQAQPSASNPRRCDILQGLALSKAMPA
jgi:hypothetical protein